MSQIGRGLGASRTRRNSVYAARAFRSQVSAVGTIRSSNVAAYSNNVFNVNRDRSSVVSVTLALQQLRIADIPLGFLVPVPNAPFRKHGRLAPHRYLHVLYLFQLLLPSRRVHVTKKHRMRLHRLRPLKLCTTGSVFVNSCLAAPNRNTRTSFRVVHSTKFILRKPRNRPLTTSL